ncbi:MAG: AgmX/PglI C-terminal domain-containing protein [Myxococcota bacterium]
MIFTCNNCNAQYKISDDRIPAKGAKVKCKKCGNIITVKPPEIQSAESESFQNEATVVQRSPFAQDEEPIKDSTRVVSAEQAAGIFKSLINEHSRSEGYSDNQGESPESTYSEEQQSGDYEHQESSEAADDRITSVYEDRSSGEIEEEAEQQVNNMLGDATDETPEEEDISREATRVVSTDQLKQMAGGDEIEREGPQRSGVEQNYYSQPEKPYVAPRSRGEWYVAIGQMQVGPLSMNEVEEKWGRGEINSTTLVWKAGMAGWQPLMYVPELSHLVPPTQESSIEEQSPIKEFKTKPKLEESVEMPSTSSAFPSLDELSKQEEELKSQKEEEAPLDWKPAAGEALASLVQDEMESINRGFSTDIPISPKSEGSVNISPPIESTVLPFEKPAEPVIPSPVIPQNISTPPVVVEQPVVVNTPYQPSYPAAYPGIYSQPPQKAQKSKLIPILIAVFGGILILGGVLGYLLYSKLSGEKVNLPDQQVQQQAKQQPQQIQQTQQAQQPQQVQPQQQVSPEQELQKKEEEVVKTEEPKKEEVAKTDEPKREEVATKKESQKQRVAMREEKAERQQPKKVIKKEEEMPPPPKEEKRPKKEEVAKVQEPEPPKKRPSKGSDSLLDFEGEQSSKGSSGGLPKTLTQEQILEVVKANIGRIKTCMAEQAQRDASIKGKLIIGWEIQPNGKTKNVQIKTAQFKGTYIGTCISSVVTDFSFPKFSGPPIPIEFPFNIK